MKEIWKDIPGYEGHYQVSNLGYVKSLERWTENPVNGGYTLSERILRFKPRQDNYLSVSLSKDGLVRDFLVHRLVALSFLSNPLNLPEVNHIDENGKNNRLDNLEWVSPSQNIQHGTGVQRAREKNSKAVAQYSLKGELISEFSSQQEASSKTGVRQGNISSAVNGRAKTAGGYIWKKI